MGTPQSLSHFSCIVNPLSPSFLLETDTGVHFHSHSFPLPKALIPVLPNPEEDFPNRSHSLPLPQKSIPVLSQSQTKIKTNPPPIPLPSVLKFTYVNNKPMRLFSRVRAK